MLTAYIQAAMRHATYEWLQDDGIYYAEIPELPGVWATAATEEELPAALQEALEGWIALGLSLHHPIPVIDSVAGPAVTTAWQEPRLKSQPKQAVSSDRIPAPDAC